MHNNPVSLYDPFGLRSNCRPIDDTVGTSCSYIDQASTTTSEQVDNESAQEGGIPSYDPSDPNYHEYVYDRAICTSSLNSNCTVSNVQYGSRLYPVPLSKGNVAVTTGDVSNAQIGLVRHVVDNETNTVVNITLSGKHMLDPGKVVRTVY